MIEDEKYFKKKRNKIAKELIFCIENIKLIDNIDREKKNSVICVLQEVEMALASLMVYLVTGKEKSRGGRS